MRIVDAQVHVWGANTPERPWPAGAERRAQRPTPLDADELLDEMDRAGVDRAVLVPPSWEGDRNDVALRASRDHPDRFAVMGRLPGQRVPAGDALARWTEQPGMLGIRLTFHLPGQGPAITDEQHTAVWEAAAAAGVPAMVYAPGQTAALGAVARAHPGLRLVVDHLGLPESAGDGDIGPAIAPLLELADLPNVAVKLSALPCHTADAFPFPALHPHIRSVLDAFGAQRCMWGSDLSRLPCKYGDWVEALADAGLGLSATDLEWVMGRTVSTWLGWP